MTKHADPATSALDRPALTEVEITPEMIAAGVGELCLFDAGDRAEIIVDAVYRAMARRAASFPPL